MMFNGKIDCSCTSQEPEPAVAGPAFRWKDQREADGARCGRCWAMAMALGTTNGFPVGDVVWRR